jgi:AbrB family looped-hinge helix DNA binding protein
MGKVTSKLQVTVPKAIAERFAIRPGTEIEWVPAGDVIPPRGRQHGLSREMRLKLFDQATARERLRHRARSRRTPPRDRGWTRDDLYQNGRAR